MKKDDIYRGIYGDIWRCKCREIYDRLYENDQQRTLKDSELLGSASQEYRVMCEGVWTAEVRRDGWICLGWLWAQSGVL